LIHEAATWLFVTGGRYAKPGVMLSPEEAKIADRNYIGISCEDYAERLRSWHAFNPWTVVLARGAKRPNGVSVVLPLSIIAYEELLAGKRPTYECSPDFLAVPTRKLLVEIIAERPHDLGAERTNPTRGLYPNLFAQCSVFLRRLDPVRADTIQLLTYFDMPLFVRRARAFGFKPTGRKLHTTGIPFFEKTLNTRTAHGQDAIFVAMLRHLGEILDSPPPD
jgi:hypothetical protein